MDFGRLRHLNSNVNCIYRIIFMNNWSYYHICIVSVILQNGFYKKLFKGQCFSFMKYQIGGILFFIPKACFQDGFLDN